MTMVMNLTKKIIRIIFVNVEIKIALDILFRQMKFLNIKNS